MAANSTRRSFQRYVLSLQYNGKLFSGSSGHPSSTTGTHPSSTPSVQEVVESALHQFADKSNVRDVQFSSRTDSGVHALGNALHVDIERRKRKKGDVLLPHEPISVQRALNSMLASKGIGITSVSTVPSTFHARLDAKHRTYMYRLIVLPKASTAWRCCLFEQEQSWIFSPSNSNFLNIDLMKAAAKSLLGRHNFSSFQNSGCQSRSAVKTLDVLDIRERRWNPTPLNDDLTSTDFSPFHFFQGSTMGINSYINGSCGVINTNNLPLVNGRLNEPYLNKNSLMTRERDIGVQEILITFRARSFLYNQVRNMVAFLVQQGDHYNGDYMEQFDSNTEVGDFNYEEENNEENKEEPEGFITSQDDIEEAERAASELLARMDRSRAPPKAPARGLYLMHVGY